MICSFILPPKNKPFHLNCNFSIKIIFVNWNDDRFPFSSPRINLNLCLFFSFQIKCITFNWFQFLSIYKSLIITSTHLRFEFTVGISNGLPFGTGIWVGCGELCTWLISCCCCCCWCCWIWLWVGMITLSVSESRRELFAVDVAVPGLSRPPELLVALSNCWLFSVEFCWNFRKMFFFYKLN